MTKVAIVIASQKVSLALFVPAIPEIVAALVMAVAEVRLTRIPRRAYIWDTKFARLVDWLSSTITAVTPGECWLGIDGFAQHPSIGGNNGAGAHLSLVLCKVSVVCDRLQKILGNCGGCFLAGYCCRCRYRDHDGLGSRLHLAAWVANGRAARGVVLGTVADTLDKTGPDNDLRTIKVCIRSRC